MDPRDGLEGCGKISPPPGFDPRTVQPVASRYTDCAIPAYVCFKIYIIYLITVFYDTHKVLYFIHRYLIKPFIVFQHVIHTILHIQLSPWGWTPKGSKHVGDKLNINLEKCALCWYALYHYITMHGAKNVKFTSYLPFLNRRTGYLTHKTITIYKYNNYNNKNWWSSIQYVSTCISHLLVFLQRNEVSHFVYYTSRSMLYYRPYTVIPRLTSDPANEFFG